MNGLVRLSLLVAFWVAIVYGTTPRSETPITNLPGLTFTPNFDQYSGYITLAGTTKNIFYWFVTSQNNPSTDPVLLWLQGGPGCSDFGGGMFLENGPYLPYVANPNSKTVTLVENPYSWNKLANVIYVDQPCGVGFSYGSHPSDKTSNDNITAVDNYLFLQGFFEVFPEWATNDFWITGESYAGVYIPTLAYQILTNSSDPQLTNNLKNGGLMLGNPVTNCGGTTYNGPGGVLTENVKVNLYYWHGMVSRRNYDAWNNGLCNTANPTSTTHCHQIYATITSGIGRLDQPLFERSAARLQPTGSINPDMLYYSYCVGNGTLDFDTAIVPNCFTLDDQVSEYLNTPAVQTAIHANPTKWNECGGVQYTKSAGPIPNYLEQIFQIAPTTRILYYAGDCDIATVPFAETQRCLATMNRPVTKNWRPYVVNLEVAGYVEEFDTYTWATIKGSGHEAPQYQPAAAYLLFSSFLLNQTLPQ